MCLRCTVPRNQRKVMNTIKYRFATLALALLCMWVPPATADLNLVEWDLTETSISSNFPRWLAKKNGTVIRGDFNGDGRDDFALMRKNWKTIPVAFSVGNGGWNIRNEKIGGAFDNGGWKLRREVIEKAMVGDFNGDGLTDIALFLPGWSLMPVIFADGEGGWNLTTEMTDNNWRQWAAYKGVSNKSGDFNGDGRADVALMKDGWTSMPVAFSDGIGGWTITNVQSDAGAFNEWATATKTRGSKRASIKYHIVEDFNGDGLSDMAVTRPGWRSIPIAFADGNGGWYITDRQVSNDWKLEAEIVPGDFNGDGSTDLSFVKRGQQTVSVALADGSGGWTYTTKRVGFASQSDQWRPDSKTKIRAGDFNRDGLTDIILARPGWSNMPIALADGSGGWTLSNKHVGDRWGHLVGTSAVEVFEGDYNADGRTDIALLRRFKRNRTVWKTMPVAFSRKAELEVPPLTSGEDNAPTSNPKLKPKDDENKR